MVIEKKQDGSTIVLIPAGLIDTSSATDFDNEIEDSLKETKNLTIDFSKVTYISSSGLRALVKAQKKASVDGVLKITNVRGAVKEVFDLTGFSEFLSLE